MKSKKYILLLLVTVSVSLQATVFTSVADGNFYLNATWDRNLIPSSLDSVIIQHNVSATNVIVYSLAIDSTGELTADDIEIDGGSLHTHNILEVETLEFTRGRNNSFVSGGVQINDWLDINNNTITIQDSIILASTIDKTANLLQIGGNGSINGQVVVQRYIHNGNRIWRYLSSPVQNASLHDWQQEIPMSGNMLNPDSCCGIHSGSTPSVYTYDESFANNKEIGWESFPTGDYTQNTPLEVGSGYVVYVRDNIDRSEYVDTKGVPNQGLINIPVTYTLSDSIENDGWNLVGNPYPCKLNWDNVTRLQRRRISRAIYWNDQSTTGSVIQRYYSNGVGIPNGTTGIIGHTQSFWVKSNMSGPSLYFEEFNKARIGDVETYYRPSQIPTIFRFVLTNDNATDETVISLHDSSLVELDDYDAWKFSSPSQIYSFTSDSIKVSINFVPYIDTIPIVIEIDNIVDPQLEFSELGEYLLLDSNFNVFDYDITTNVTKLYLVKDVISSTQPLSDSTNIEIYPNPSEGIVYVSGTDPNVNYTVIDSYGKIVLEGILSSDIIDISSLRTGTYFIAIENKIEKIIKL